MKKIKSIKNSYIMLLVVVLIFAMLTAACSSNQSGNVKENQNANVNNNASGSENSNANENEGEKENKTIVLATTTSVNDSGLLRYLQPELEKDTGIQLKIVAQGTGQAIKTAENGDADVLFVHDKQSEEKFVSEGHGVERIEIMYNYFVIVGPKDDPAGIKDMEEKNAAKALKKIMEAGALFV